MTIPRFIYAVLVSVLFLKAHGSTGAKFALGTVQDDEPEYILGSPPEESYLQCMYITCTNYLDPIPAQSTWSIRTFPNIIHINNCTLPTEPLVDFLDKLDIDHTKIDRIKIYDSRLPTALPENYTAGLQATKITLSNVIDVTENFFKNLKNLGKITVENMDMPPLVANEEAMRRFVEEYRIRKYPRQDGLLLTMFLKNTTIKTISNCDYLEILSIQDLNEDQVHFEWPEKCGLYLKSLQLHNMSPELVQRISTYTYPIIGLQQVIINNCSLEVLPDMVTINTSKGNRYLNTIILRNNRLTDEAFLQFPMTRNLETLDVSNNLLNGQFIENVLPNTGGSTTQVIYNFNNLIADGNNFTNVFDGDIKTKLAKHFYLRHISLNYMALEPDCLRHTRFQQLQHLSLISNSSKLIENLQLHDLPATKGAQLTVDLRGRPVRTVRIGPNFTENFESLSASENWLLNKGYKLVVFLDFVDCYCNNDVLQRALKQFPEYLYMPGLRCNSKNGGLFLDEPMENLNCRKAVVNGCKRRLSRDEEYTTVADCSGLGRKFRWPRPERLRGLNAADNGITSLAHAYLPGSLEWLDLRNNNITRLNVEETAQLFGNAKRRLWLSENPIDCVCENSALLEALQNKSHQIVDYDAMRCSEGHLLSDISLFELCRAGHSIVDVVRKVQPTQKLEHIITCHGDLDSVRPISPRKAYQKITLQNCILSMVPIAKVFRSLNVNMSAIDTLQLTDSSVPQFLSPDYTSGLKIQTLEMTNIQYVPYDFFASLTQLRELSVKNMDLPSLPVSTLKSLVLENSMVNSWDRCSYLRELHVINMSRDQLPTTWPESCAGLSYLTLEMMMPDAVWRMMTSVNETSLRELHVNHCSLVELPLQLMQHFSRLDVLDFSFNLLEDRAFSSFPDLSELKTLNLAHNKLTGEFLIEVVSKVPGLRRLILDGNNFGQAFQNFEIKSALTRLNSLTELSLNNMTLEVDCLMYSNFTQLEYLHLNYYSNESEEPANLKLYGLPRTGADQLTVEMKGRTFRSVVIDTVFTEFYEEIPNPTDFWLVKKGYNLIMKLDSVDCDCNNDALSRLLQSFSSFISMPGLKCDQEGRSFSSEPMENLNCRRAIVNGCERRISRDYNYVTVVDCSKNKERFLWPHPDKSYKGLNATGNHISSLRKAYLPESLQWIDLSYNAISRLDTNESASLFNYGRRVWLSGNPIECVCDNSVLLSTLQTHYMQIMDYNSLTCAWSEQPLRLVSIDELCRFKQEYVWAFCASLLVLSLIVALFLRHYWVQIRTILYARGYCMSCLNEDDVDEDRPFDAFISFAHGDDEYVMEQLVPQLEGEPNYYRLCVHYRDWAFGEWIPAQIMQSVRLSKRTVIVLSKKFVTSWWGAMEFRYAQAAAMAEGRSRLLVLILDDVLSEKLVPELQSYLALNTYLKCDDPWFWEKLRYAMPRTKRMPRQDNAWSSNVSTSSILPLAIMQAVEKDSHSAPIDATNGTRENIEGLKTV